MPTTKQSLTGHAAAIAEGQALRMHRMLSRWRFTKSREGKRGGPYVKVNHWPSLVVSRQDGFGWRMEVFAPPLWFPYDHTGFELMCITVVTVMFSYIQHMSA